MIDAQEVRLWLDSLPHGAKVAIGADASLEEIGEERNYIEVGLVGEVGGDRNYVKVGSPAKEDSWTGF